MTCPHCGQQVLRVRDAETGLDIDLELAPLPITEPIGPFAPVWEQHPTQGWYAPVIPEHRNFPIHAMHTHAKEKVMTSSIWDNPELQVSEFVSFETVGDSIEGVITEVGTQTFEARDDKPAQTVPQLHLRKADGTEVILTAGQFKLSAALVKERPNVGDNLSVKYTGKTGRMKNFDVTVTKGTAPVDTSAAPF